jgi:hypothetical protein
MKLILVGCVTKIDLQRSYRWMQVCTSVAVYSRCIVANILWRNVMKVTSKSGAAIAAAAATLFLAGATMSTSTYAADEGHCIGANACKGQSACKGGNHACKGQNACKGQGFSAMTKDKCAAAKGKFEPA